METYLLITLDPNAGFPYDPFSPTVTCSATSVNGHLVNALFVCLRISSNQIKVTGFNTFVSVGDEIGIQMSLKNPSYS